MKVSIIIPLYNKAPYIKKALETVCSQTYQDWECIIMDDGSTDGSAEVAKQWLQENRDCTDSRFHLLSQSNAGVAAARNNAVKHSRGELLCFLDADDWWEPTFIEEMVRFTELVPSVGLWASNYIYYKPGKTHVGVTNLAYEDTTQTIFNYPKSYAQGTGMPIWTGATMMRRSVFDEMGGFPLGVRLGEDFLLWAKVALRYPVAFLDKPLAYYNNDVPAALRATRNLHDPQKHMLFLLEPIENEIARLSDAQQTDWRKLLSKLRANGLLEYWLDERYHNLATKELQKVDWTSLPSDAQRPYLSPIWQVKAKKRFMRLGSYCKQKLIQLIISFRRNTK